MGSLKMFLLGRIIVTLAFLTCLGARVLGNEVRLGIRFDEVQQAVRFSIPQPPGTWEYYDLEMSTNLQTWTDFARFRFYTRGYAERATAGNARRYFRARILPPEPVFQKQWANELTSRDLTKFVILTNDLTRVYFHPGQVLHYEFASRQFPEMAQLDPEAFDQQAIYPERQKIILGGIVVIPGQAEQAYGVEFVSAQPFPPARLAELFRAVTNRIDLPEHEAFLLPTSLQEPSVVANLSYFIDQGIRVRGLRDFLPKESSVHSEGWALGTLKYIASRDLAAAWSELTPETILITDDVPRDLPPLAGLISLTASSPNSHTVIRLSAQSLPYYDWPTLSTSDLSNLLGREVLFSVQAREPIARDDPAAYQEPWRVELVDAATLPESVRTELQERSVQLPTNTPPRLDRTGFYAKNVDELQLSDSQFFGAKAANYGVLRRAIPESSPEGIAFSFDLWLDFMNQELPSGEKLKKVIAATLDQGTNAASLAASLASIRKLIVDTADFNAEQRGTILSALLNPIFTPDRKIRFRSSSNAEDLPEFSAAGIYDSYSGCLLDDLEGTSDEVCLCDPADDKSRSVFRAIQRVYASFYNDQAYAERRKHQIDESAVGMALLVHHSFPDEEELANGVATIQGIHDLSSGVWLNSIKVTSQRGAISVANPAGSDRPEKYESNEPGYLQGAIREYSTIRPRQTPVLGPESEYQKLIELFKSVLATYAKEASQSRLNLNFEFKKTAAGLQVKQVRPLGTKSRDSSIILPRTLAWNTYQGGYIYANYTNQPTLESNHALKSLWTAEFAGGAIDNLQDGLGGFARCMVQYIEGDQIVSNSFTLQESNWVFNQALREWDFGSVDPSPDFGMVRSRFVAAGEERAFDLNLFLRTSRPANAPFLDPLDIMVQASVPGKNGVAQLTPIGMEFATLPRTNIVSTNGVTIRTTYTLGVHPKIPIVGVGPTMSLSEWGESTISGLTSEPFVLTGYFSQTYYADRHNLGEHFIFEPQLEEGIPAGILQELKTRDIKQIRASVRPWSLEWRARIQLIGFSGNIRDLPRSE